jgi:hypothetical protein
MNDKLIKYLSGEMNPSEEQKFLIELEKSPEMMEKRLSYENLIKDIRTISSAELDNDYFREIIPSFRKRIERKQRVTYNFKWASGIAVSAAALLITVLIIFNDKTKSFDEMMMEMDNSEIAQLVQEHDIDISAESENSLIEQMYYDILDLNGDTRKVLHSDLISDAVIYNLLSDNESDIIFAELINKDILR